MSAPSLPDDVDALKRLLVQAATQRDALAEQLDRERGEALVLRTLVEQLKLQIARLKRAQFGRSSEQLGDQIAQLGKRPTSTVLSGQA